MNKGERYEDRWGPSGAMLYRFIIPAGIFGLIILALPAIWFSRGYGFVLYPVLVLMIAYCCGRNAVITSGRLRIVAIALGALLTIGAAVIAFGLFIASGGI